jgi:acyl carrier protein
MIPAEDVTASKSLTQYGVDSLVAVEMRNWIFRRFKHNVPILQLMGADSLATLSSKICQSFA